jgi:hypothetical protein
MRRTANLPKMSRNVIAPSRGITTTLQPATRAPSWCQFGCYRAVRKRLRPRGMVEQVTKHNVTNSCRDAVRQRIASTTRLPVLMASIVPARRQKHSVNRGPRGGGRPEGRRRFGGEAAVGGQTRKFLIPQAVRAGLKSDRNVWSRDVNVK